MDSYSPSSPVYHPEAESDQEEDIGSPVYRSPTPKLLGQVPFDAIHRYVRTSEFVRQGMEHGIRHDLQGQRIDSQANQIWYQKEKISTIEKDKEMLENRTEAARAGARSATRVTIAVLVLVIICFLVESYQRR
ncbi:hypothetical protein L1987_77992 [Smallanthus sonchifolius]|uniref:Uncharacterized protein n=1 Tax=Smallanthus sonchifolius TaxID=185202 RepID=A0ACB8ZFV9_9ASTR|nr:hypothetical protein L1987_77992 [Smallanthus sonchifolius]